MALESSAMGRVQLGISKTLPLQQQPRGFVVQVNVVERVRQDFGHPDQTGLDIKQDEQMECSEQQRRDAEVQPGITHGMHELAHRLMLRNQAQQTRVEENHQGQQNPDAEQHDFASQVVAHLDFFLVLIRRLVDVVIAEWLKEEMTCLTRRHGDQPGNQRCPGRVNEKHGIRNEKTHRTQKMQGLVNPAMVVVTVIVPTLDFQGVQKVFHRQSSYQQCVHHEDLM